MSTTMRGKIAYKIKMKIICHRIIDGHLLWNSPVPEWCSEGVCASSVFTSIGSRPYYCVVQVGTPDLCGVT